MVDSDTHDLHACPVAVRMRGRGESVPESRLLQVIPPSPGICVNSSSAEWHRQCSLVLELVQACVAHQGAWWLVYFSCQLVLWVSCP